MVEPVDRTAIRIAESAELPEALLAVIRDKDLDGVLQRVGTAMLRMARTSPEHRAALTTSTRSDQCSRLSQRS